MSTTVSSIGLYHLDSKYAQTLFSIAATSLAAAQTAAQSLATIIQESLFLIALGNVEIPTLYAPGGQGGNVSAPAGVSRSPM